MTTSTQQTVLSVDELNCLRALATGNGDVRDVQVWSLVAKGMLVSAAEPTALTPAGHHALHVGEPGMVPGIDE
ncbi:MAG TPA: hypothetical protein VNS31_04185 [Ramlibacter sp.]|jgi:hypothetical protein|nr:hypothetical protein [Ramlibacter sp.]